MKEEACRIVRPGHTAAVFDCIISCNNLHNLLYIYFTEQLKKVIIKSVLECTNPLFFLNLHLN